MTLKITYLIVPALTDQAGQCRIASTVHDAADRATLQDYRDAPHLWNEAGIMNSRGELVCLEQSAPHHPSHFHHMKQDEPLAAGTTYTFVAGEPA